MSPAAGWMPARSVARACASSSIRGECATKSLAGTGQRSTRRADSSAPNSASASGSPDTTVAAGLFTAATDRRPSHRVSRSRTACSGITTETMPPSASSADRARLRTATTRAASSSVRIPATVAAAISPWLWPSTASGVIPAACQTAARDTITAHSTGWVTSAESRLPPPSITSWRSQPTCGARTRAHSASFAANTGEQAASSRPIPAHWAPWPGNTNTTRPGSLAAVSATTPGRPAVSSSRLVPTSTARCSNTDRVAASDQATSAGPRPGWVARYADSRPAWARNAVGGPPRHHPRRRAAHQRHGRGLTVPADGGGLFEDEVDVGAAHPERGHARPAGALAGGPRHGLGQQAHRARRPVDVGGGLVGVQGPGQQGVLEGQHHLDHAGRARRLLRVADVRLHRAQPQRAVLRAALAVGGEQGLRLDRVTQGGPGPVRLHRIERRPVTGWRSPARRG